VQQTIYQPGEHTFPLEEVDKDALYVMEKLRNAGHLCYLVGGSVRDLLLQKKPKDFDISTSALPEEIRKLFRNCILIGRRFRLAHIRFGRKILEVSTFRSGDNESENLIVRDNEWGTPEQDALRRDFTINGLFYDPFAHTIIDYVGGFADLQHGQLRTIGQPFFRFKQDPVRMIRLVKFQARFGFEIDPETKIALLECRSEIIKSSSARVLEELLRMLESSAAHPFFEQLTHYGLLQLILPVLGEFLEKPEGQDIYNYLREVDTTFHAPHLSTLDRSVLLACLLFPYLQGRIATRFLQREKIPHLGEIQQESFTVIDEVFPTSFRLPRRLKYGLASILISQFRLTPLEKRRSPRLRVPQDPDFPLALKFLEVRSCLEPGLQQVREEWEEALTNTQKGGPRAPAKKRRRRRPRGSSPSTDTPSP
jgi:poly(A) polymerase